jgi:ubiquinone/menaquinone biosynthesis C-methylase UbiE
MAEAPLERTLREERAFHDERYGASRPLRPDTRQTFRDSITPPFLPGGSPRGVTQLRAYELLLREGIEGKQVLDYACGLGKWSVHLAQLGASVSGFDLSGVAIERAKERAAYNGLEIRFDEANAAALPYADEEFDVAIGVAALHHVSKYAGTADELRRVMRPGGLVVFTENYGHNPLLELGRRLSMRELEGAGDVVLTEAAIHDWAAGFSSVEIEPYSLLLMAKRAFRGRYGLLSALQTLDEELLRLVPALRRYCGECVIVLRR